MKIGDSPHFVSLLALAIAALVGGCGSVPAQNYYVLTAMAATTGAAGNAAAASTGGASSMPTLVVAVDPAHVPELVDRPQIVISHGDNRVTILEQQRWAEPLRAAIAQTIALDLARELDGARVSATPQDLPEGGWRLALDVQRFESRPGDYVAIEIDWTLRRRGGDPRTAARTGRSTAREPAPAGNYDALAAAHSKALAAISREIAAALESAAR